ncbi:putative peptidase [Nocardia nova SH22a]|uniref:Putative peptidase n=1 Tax=Nocardia nova SH22a TaxID=1415166 RepID=W5TBK6_9NOCA|nr:peptidoglycan DD-metalloendopeptidase family protein [Nocardia nova]AHH16597.1 putative peptidase [Nocardia nova SH22a]
MSARYWPLGAGRIVTSGFGARPEGWHWGCDFGRDGGSGGMPVYAAQAGRVIYAGAASGFGGPDPAGWIVLDHPTEAGSGTTVYGHIVREVSIGQQVAAGQRIGHINPSSATNGGVAPHLHFEVHRSVWSSPGPDRLDPLPWLTGAKEPGGENMPADIPAPVPVTFGIDISSFQAGLDLAQVFREGFEFVIAKVTEGDYYRDAQWRGFRDATLAAGKILVGYHYVRGDCDIEAQADLFLSHIGDPSIPAMIDHEANSGGANVARAMVAALQRRGVHVGLTYLPRWYHGQIGSPDLTGLPPLMSSSYGANRAGYASAIYPGSNDSGWNGYGGLDVAIFQFSEAGRVAGRNVDVDAFRGTPDQLRALLTGDEEMPSADEIAKAVWAHRPAKPNGKTDATTGEMLGWTDHHAGLAVDQLAGAGSKDQPGDLDPTRWDFLADRSVPEALGLIGAKLGIPGFRDPLAGGR